MNKTKNLNLNLNLNKNLNLKITAFLWAFSEYNVDLEC
jgi:hypothetical protein